MGLYDLSKMVLAAQWQRAQNQIRLDATPPGPPRVVAQAQIVQQRDMEELFKRSRRQLPASPQQRRPAPCVRTMAVFLVLAFMTPQSR